MPSPKAFFVTGTDTNVGKTLVACALLTAARARGLSTAAAKPVAAGISQTDKGLHNEDAVALAACCVPALEIETINPVCFDEPVAPHIAAQKGLHALRADLLAGHCRTVLDMGADLTLVEGAGGWKVPLGTDETMADMVKQLELPVIMVVGMRLGCLNHALLTAQAIREDGLQLAGWVANSLSPDMPMFAENRDTLKAMLPAPMLGEISWLEIATPEAAAACLDMDLL